jgi:aryl-alcohol dehydrogenase-like predicted oxidoreductase
VAPVAAELGTTSTAVALAWICQRPGIDSVIIGPRTLDQLNGNLAGFTLDLPADTVAHLDEISRPGQSPAR